MQWTSKLIAAGRATVAGIAHGLRREPLIYWDVGARRGLRPALLPLYGAGLLVPVFFDPDPDEAKRLHARYKRCTVVDGGLWNEDKTETLHLTHEPGCSSILVPVDQSQIEKRIQIQVYRADSVIREKELPLPDIIKLDIQGAELAALEGFGTAIDRIYCVEAEVAFSRTYEKQPLITDVVEFLNGRGFGLIDVQPFGVRSTRSAQQANAFFVRKYCTGRRQGSVENVFRKLNSITMVH